MTRLVLAYVVLLLLPPGGGIATPFPADSLERKLTTASGAERLQVLCSLCDGYGIDNRTKSQAYCKEALTLATQIREKKKLLLIYKRLGEIQKAEGHNDSALFYYEKFLATAQSEKAGKETVTAFNKIGIVYQDEGNLTESTSYYLKALQLAEEIADSAGIANAYNNMGFVYKLQKDFDQAISSFSKTLLIRQKLKDKKGVAGAINNIGIIYIEQKKYLPAREQFLQAAGMMDSTQDLRPFAMIYNNIGITYEDTGEHEKAYDYYMRSLRIKEKLNDKRGIASSYGNIGANFTEAGQYDKAIPFLKKSYELSAALHAMDMMITATRNLYRCYEAKGNYKLAYAYLQETTQREDSLYNIQKASLIADMTAKYETEKKDRENEKLKSENLLKSSQAQNSFYSTIILALLAGLLVGVAFYLWRRNLHRAKTNALLNKYNVQIKEVNQQLQDTVSEKNLVMNVVAHDLKSPLNKVKGLLELVKIDGVLNANQQNYVQKIEQVVEQGRKLITDLLSVNQATHHNLEKSEISLITLFQGLEQEFEPQALEKNIRLQFSIHTYHPNFVSLKDHVVRVLDNLISNAIKYSPVGRSVYVSVEKMKGGLLFRIKDEGPGFTEADKKNLFKTFQRLSAQPTAGESSNGLGLAIVKQLCDELNAEIELHSEPKEGAEFVIKLPVTTATPVLVARN